MIFWVRLRGYFGFCYDFGLFNLGKVGYYVMRIFKLFYGEVNMERTLKGF